MAAGDSWDDPIIIGNDCATMNDVWNDFYSKAQDGSNKYIRFKDINIDEEGNFTITGDGSRNNPFKVSTYNEMLHAFGANYIYQCKLYEFNKDDPLAIRKYMYYNGTDTLYCDFDPRPTTIDLNNRYNGYISSVYISNHLDCNGWTWLNLQISFGGSHGEMLSCGYISNSKANIKNMIALNLRGKSSSEAYIFGINIYDSIIQLELEHTYNGILGLYYSTSYGYGFTRNSLRLTGVSAGYFKPCINGNNIPITDSIIDFDIQFNQFGSTNSGAYNPKFDVQRSILKGKIKYTSNNSYPDWVYLTDSIVDINFITNATVPAPSSSLRSVFNKDKVNWSDTATLVGVDSTQMLSPTELRNAGLLIGVDT